MNKARTSLKNAQAALEIARKNYEAKLQELSQLEQKAQAVHDSGDETTVRQLATQAIKVESQLEQLDAEIKDLEQFIKDRPKKNNFIPLLLMIPLALILAGGGLYISLNKQPQVACLPSGTKLRISGSTSMGNINTKLKELIEKKCRGMSIEIAANGSAVGIQQLEEGNIDIAAVSRPLTAQQQAKQLVATYLKRDDIALIVGKENPYTQGLTSSQVVDIFKGNITNWSALGARPATIRVINRPDISGTQNAFKELVLNNATFGTTPNIITHPIDETTGIIRILKADGISYASYAQVKNETTARVINIDGSIPNSSNYPLKRQLFYVYKEPRSPAAKFFLDYLKSSDAESAIEQKKS
jgi:phosphate transport system substrate-binding protein